MNNKTVNKNINFSMDIGFTDILILVQIVLIILKLCGVLNGSWWVILLPTLIPVGFFVLLFVVLPIACMISPRFRRSIDKVNAENKKERELEEEND